MSFKAKLFAVVAVSALTAATVAPALALENNFNGLIRLKSILSNTNNFGSGDIFLAKDPTTNYYLEQRARLLYTAKVSDDLKGVLQFEIDSRWGDQAYGANSVSIPAQTTPGAPLTNGSYTGRNSGGGLEADRVNLETKNVYLDFRVPGTQARAKAGIQGFSDDFKGIFLGYADVAGLVANTKLGKADVTAGWLRFWDINEGSQTAKQSSVNTYLLDGNYPINPNLKVGLAYYFLTDGAQDAGATLGTLSGFKRAIAAGFNYDDLRLHMVGAKTEAKIGPVSVDGFLVGQFGKFEGVTGAFGAGATKKDVDVRSFAANARAKMKAGPGTAKVEALYVSGDGLNNGTYSSFINGSQYNLAASFYVSPDMQLLLPNKYDINTSSAVAYDVNFKSQGVIGGFVGYDANLTNKVYASANAGFMAAATDNANRPKGVNNTSNYLGSEINAEVGYKFYDNLTASLQGAYLVLGDYFKGTVKTIAGAPADPENPFTSRVMLNYTF